MSVRQTGIIVAVAVLVVFAGCSSMAGGGTASAEQTETPDGTPTPGQAEKSDGTATPTPTPEDEQQQPQVSSPSPPTDVEVERTAGEWGSDRTVTGNVSKLSVGIPQLDVENRGVWVYVPPGYDDGSERYPVVYMQDGQNLFDEQAAFQGEWGVDETMQRLAEEEDLEAIVVGVENGGFQSRGDEYLPWNSTLGDYGGNGSEYAAFLAETLKPTIDQRYRTEPDNATILGSSFGGVISLYTAFEYPDQFQQVGGMSNAHMGVPQIYDFLNESGTGPERVYIDWGTNETQYADQFVAVNQRMTAVLSSLGYDRGESLLATEEEGGVHRESEWRERFPRAIQWLLTGTDPAG